MKPEQSTINALQAARAKATNLTAADKDGIVETGSRVETVLSIIGPDCPPLTDVLMNCLSVLQHLYQDALADPAAAVAQLVQTILAMETAIRDNTLGDAPAMAAVTASLQATIAAPAGASAPAAAPAENIDAAAIEGHVNGLFAMLMGLAPDSTTDLKKALEGLARTPAALLPPASQTNLAAARNHLQTLADGSSADAAQDLAQAITLLGAICEDLANQLLVDPAAATSPTPPPAPAPVTSTPTAATPATEAPAAAPAASAAVTLPADTDMDLLKEYITESLDHIAAGENALLVLETDRQNSEAINTVFRAFHTIKGTSGFLGLNHIQRLAHLAESLLDRARSGQIAIAGGYADLSLKSCDMLRTMIEALRSAQPGDALPTPDAFAEFLETLKNPEAAGVSAETDAKQNMRLGDILVARDQVDRQTIEEVAQQQADKPLGAALVEKKVVSATDVASALRTQKQMAGTAADTSIRVNTDRLDHLINMVGELVIGHSMVAQDPTVASGQKPRLARNVAHTGKIVRELQDLTMSLRMVELKPTFQKMARLVRDLGRKSGKNLQFVTEGEETEIDRNMVEALNDPLVHMMRNACDHGVEAPEVRAAQGKNPVGTVTLRAYQSAGNVVIELADDGKGLDRDRILAKAVERKLVEPGREMTESEIFGLIFLPGFSTAEKITDVSGRGVGMDVVKRGIESLRGRIEIASRPGQGTTFTIRLPLTMAITDAMLLRVGEQRYLLPTVSIEHSFRPTAGMVSTVTGKGQVLALRGRLLPVFQLRELFHVANACQDPTEALMIIVEGEGRRCALMVDELLGQQQVVIKSLGSALGQIPGVAGGAILGDGRVGLILDPAGILKLANGVQTRSDAA